MTKSTLLATVLVAFSFASIAAAGTITIPKDEPAALATVPGSWKPEETEHGYAIESPDQVATVLLEVTTVKGADKLLDENIDWLVKDQEVKINAKSKKESEIELAGRKWSVLSWDADSKEWGASVVGFIFSEVGNGKVMTVTYWITKKDSEKHMPDDREDSLEREIGRIIFPARSRRFGPEIAGDKKVLGKNLPQHFCFRNQVARAVRTARKRLPVMTMTTHGDGHVRGTAWACKIGLAMNDAAPGLVGVGAIKIGVMMAMAIAPIFMTVAMIAMVAVAGFRGVRRKQGASQSDGTDQKEFRDVHNLVSPS